MSLFVIVDISNLKSSPLDYRPRFPIIWSVRAVVQKKRGTFATFGLTEKYDKCSYLHRDTIRVDSSWRIWIRVEIEPAYKAQVSYRRKGQKSDSFVLGTLNNPRISFCILRSVCKLWMPIRKSYFWAARRSDRLVWQESAFNQRFFKRIKVMIIAAALILYWQSFDINSLILAYHYITGCFGALIVVLESLQVCISFRVIGFHIDLHAKG